MPIVHTEIRGSGEGRDSNNRDGSGVLKYSVRGDNNLANVQAYVIAQNLFPETVIYGGRTMAYKDASWTNPAFGKWVFTGQYQEPDRADRERRLDLGEARLSFDTTGGTLHVYSSKETVGKYPSTAPDHKTAIGVKSGLEDPEGVDIVIPALKISVTYRLAQAAVDVAYVKLLAGLTGTTNDDTFYGFDAEELLFMGATGNISTKTDPEITFNYAASQNLTGLQIGDLTGISKKGHDYLWMAFYSELDSAATPRETTRRPKAVYVERLYEKEDWTAFGIGTSL